MRWSCIVSLIFISNIRLFRSVKGQQNSPFEHFRSMPSHRERTTIQAPEEEYFFTDDDKFKVSSSRRYPEIEFRAGPLDIHIGPRDRGGRGKDKDRPNLETEDQNVPRERSIGSSNSENSGSQRNIPDQSPCGPDNVLCHGENYVKEIGLKWSTRVHNGTGVFIRDPSAPGNRRFLPIGIAQPNEKFGRCKTHENQRGYCRHLEHCVQDIFVQSFIKFLEYQCDIPRQNFLGVCCPEPEENTEARRPNGNNFPFFPPMFQPTTSSPRHRTTRRSRNQSPSNEGQFPRRDSTGCGVSEKKIARIVGGRVADPTAWPWMVAILKKTEAVDYRAGQYCGGVLISEFHVLTAGHCVDNFPIDTLNVRIGEYDFAKPNSSRVHSLDIDIAKVTVHENYNRYTYQNDIAVLELTRSAFFNKRISSICLPPSDSLDSTFVNEFGFVTGFGTIYYGGPASDKLMEISVPIWSQEQCRAAYTQPIEDTNLCAGVRAGSRDSCQGDSGGPLQLQIRGRWTTVGIVSWGIRCSEPGYPGVYTRVTKYLDWISRNTKQ